MYRRLQKAIYYVSAVLFGLSAILAAVCVFFRYLLNNSIIWGEEAIRLMFIWMFMFSAAECFRKEKHITLDIFLELWPKNVKRICKIIIDISLIVFLAMVVYLGIKSCLSNAGQRTTALGISFGIVYMAIPLGGVLMIFFIVHNLIAHIRNKEPAAKGRGT
jgi:TRAP-type C4-dicarboxylate transport system permease small subunit